MYQDYKKRYIQLLKEFLEKIPKDIPMGMPSPMIPCVGELYDFAKLKIAIYGMETRGWVNLVELVGMSAEDAFTKLTEQFRNQAFLEWTNNFHTSFWDFILIFLKNVYHVESVEKLVDCHENLLRSFIWGNVDSLERYEVSAEGNGVDLNVWEKIKECSISFDKAYHILNSCLPDVFIITCWQANEKVFFDNENLVKESLGEHIEYFYIEKTKTHVYKIAHPGYFAKKSLFKSSIEVLVNDLRKRCPDICAETAFNQEQYDAKMMEEISDCRTFVGNLAVFLASNRCEMSGRELTDLLNRNKNKTTYGTLYGGDRNVYNLIRESYRWFRQKGELQKSNAIVKAFVKEDGTYACL